MPDSKQRSTTALLIHQKKKKNTLINDIKSVYWKQCCIVIVHACTHSSDKEALDTKCEKLRSIFLRSDYPKSLIDFHYSKSLSFLLAGTQDCDGTSSESSVRIIPPFKDQVDTNAVRRQLFDPLKPKVQSFCSTCFCEHKIRT